MSVRVTSVRFKPEKPGHSFLSIYMWKWVFLADVDIWHPVAMESPTGLNAVNRQQSVGCYEGDEFLKVLHFLPASLALLGFSFSQLALMHLLGIVLFACGIREM